MATAAGFMGVAKQDGGTHTPSLTARQPEKGIPRLRMDGVAAALMPDMLPRPLPGTTLAIVVLLILLAVAGGTLVGEGHLWVAGMIGAVAVAGAAVAFRRERVRHRVEAELADRDARLRAVVETAGDGLLVVDRDGVIRFANPAAAKLTGRRLDDLRGHALGLPLGGQDQAELDIPGAGGDHRVARMRVEPITWDGAEHTLVLLQDITDLKHREHQLRRETRIHAMLSAANQAVVRTDTCSELLERFCRDVVDIGGYALAWVGLVEADGGTEVVPLFRSGGDTSSGPPLQDLDTGFAREAARRRRSIVHDDLRKADAAAVGGEWAVAHGYRAAIALPLTSSAGLQGVLCIYNDAPGAYDSDEHELLLGLANDLAHGIHSLQNREAHRQAEAARAEAERQYRMVLESAGEGIIGVDPEGRITFANPAAARMLGYAEGELRGQPIHDLLHHSHPDGRPYEERECPMHATLEDGQTRRVDDEVLWRADGSTLPVDYLSNPVWRDGVLTGSVVSFIDIRRRQEAEAQRDRLSAIIEATPDLVSYATPEGRILYVNPGGRRLLGWEDDATLPQTWTTDRRPQWAAERVREEAYPTVLREGVWRGETAFIGAGGEEIPVLQTLLAHYDGSGEVAYVSTIARDIRDRKELETALRAAAAREEGFANSVISTLPGVYYLFDRAGVLHRWNRELERVTGHPGETLAQTPVIELIASKDRERVEAAIQRVFAEGEATVEADLLTAQGRRTPFMFTGAAIETADGPLVSGVGLDISRRKAAERKLRRLATHDALTGLFNRRRVDQELDQQVAAAQRYGRPLSVVLFDIDHFKRVNDSHGHEAGDEVLKGLAETATDCTRDSDILSRWGGEEFLLVAPETDLAGAEELAEKLRGRIAERVFPEVGRVTISAGVAQLETDEAADAVVKRADDALYRAKEGGRNRVESDPDGAAA